MSRAATRVSGVLLRGLEDPAERRCLVASVALCVAYLTALAALHFAGTRMDDRFLARREAVRLSHLLQHRLAVGVPVTDTDARIALLNGWSAPESWGVWTDGKQAEFGLALPRPLPSSPVLQVTAEIMPPPGGRQVIRLEGNQLPLGEWRLGSGHAVICAALPQQVTAGSGLLRLSVGIGSPQRPPGGVDTRDLGLGLETVTIVPSAADCGKAGR